MTCEMENADRAMPTHDLICSLAADVSFAQYKFKVGQNKNGERKTWLTARTEISLHMQDRENKTGTYCK